MLSDQSFAQLEDVWGDFGRNNDDDAGGLELEHATAPTCRRPAPTAGSREEPWCDLYYNGYSKDVDSIMDMYTPGDKVRDDVRYHSRTQAPLPATDGPLPSREPEARAVTAPTSHIAHFPFAPFESGSAFAPFLAEVREEPPPRRRGSAADRAERSARPARAEPLPDLHYARADLGDGEECRPAMRPERRKGSVNSSSRKALTSDDDDEEVYDYSTPRVRAPAPAEATKEAFAQPQESAAGRTATTAYAELALYVLSGVLLIIIMEQFVQIGLHMR